MDGIYFFGDHLRWNLGWSNPNQAGVFIAMWIPWLWGLGAWVSARRNGEGARCSLQGLRRDAAVTLVLAAELILWFLLCKTYSRGALVAVGLSGVVFFVWSGFRDRRLSDHWQMALRLTGLVILLFLTGFFSRIDPRFVSQDASAGNRLVLWKGGLQMIAVSPWLGWGKGQSGNGFMQWFQPLNANEQYAGMVNSYLHVGVEYGLPVLAVAMAGALGLCLISWRSVGARRSEYGLSRDAAVTFMMGAGCSLLVFLTANVFSTLWIFRDLWWLPVFSSLWIAFGGKALLGRGFWKTAGITFGTTFSGSAFLAVGLWAVGKSIPSDVRFSWSRGGESVIRSADSNGDLRMWFFPDKSVLGENWGKEIRRLVTSPGGRPYEIVVPTSGKSSPDGFSPALIVACGREFTAGFSAIAAFPDCELILVHPVGQPVIPSGPTGRVSVILPMLDTGHSGKAWRLCCRKNDWACSTSRGVGQDARLVWPEMLTDGLQQE